MKHDFGHRLNKLLKKSRTTTPICKVNYRNCVIESGMVKNSPHKENELYFTIGQNGCDLTRDEALAVINTLSATLFQLQFEDKKK